MLAALNGAVDAANNALPTWGTLGIGLAAVISWLGAIFSGVILAKANGGIAKAADKMKDDMQRASNIAVENVRGELGQAAETHKSALRKQEWLFDKELDATKAFINLKSRYIPAVRSFQFNEEDAAAMIAQKIDKLQTDLFNFRESYIAVLPQRLRESLTDCITDLTYGLSQADIQQPDAVNLAAREKLAGRLHSKLMTLEDQMVEMIRF